MKTDKYSAIAAFFGRGKHAPAASKKEGERVAALSKETGVSARALVLFSRIADDRSFTAEAAHKDFGGVKRKQVA
jgi:hypothetical protein